MPGKELTGAAVVVNPTATVTASSRSAFVFLTQTQVFFYSIGFLYKPYCCNNISFIRNVN